jgi:lipopolysaccharide export system permease protein
MCAGFFVWCKLVRIMSGGIIQRYLAREVALTAGAVTLVLWLIVMTARLASFLGMVAEGRLPAAILFSLLGLKSLTTLAGLLPVALMLGTILAFGRLYRDSEMSAMVACGAGPTMIYRGLLNFVLPCCGVIALLALVVGPWADGKAYRLQKTAIAGSLFFGVNEGRFNELPGGEGMLYVETVDKTSGQMRNVVYQTRRDERIVVLTAPVAFQEARGAGEHFLVLLDGHRYEGVPGMGEWVMADFRRHGIALQEPEPDFSVMRTDAWSTAQLWASGEPKKVAEIHRRLSLPLMGLIMALMALPLSKSSPRDGRYGRMFIGILIYVAYSNALTLGQSWLERSHVPLLLGLWWIHGLALLGWLAVLDSDNVRWLWRRLARSGA